MTAELPAPAPTPSAVRTLVDRIAADAALTALAGRWVPLSAETADGPIDAITLIAGAGPMVLLGRPGSGKTAALQAAWHRLARAGQAGRAVAPIYIDLAHARDGEGLPDLIARALDALGIAPDALTPTHLLLDNLDRMRHRYLLDDLRLVIDAGGRVGPTAIMACRADDWAEIHSLLPGVTAAQLQPLAEGAVDDALVRFLPAAVAEAAAAWLAAAADLAAAVRQPRVLAAFLDVATGLPAAEWRLARVGDALLTRILAGVPSAERGLYRDALADVALSAHGRAFIPQVDTMAMRLSVTRYDMLRTGAVVPRGADLEFTEPLLARHCAATALINRFGTAPEALAGQLQALGDPSVAPLLVHAYDLAPDPARYLAALRRLPGAAPIIAACLGLDDPLPAPTANGPAVDVVDGVDVQAPAGDAPVREAVPARTEVEAPTVEAPNAPAAGAHPGDGDPSQEDRAAAAANLRAAWQLTRSADVAHALAEVEAERGALAEAAQALNWAVGARPGVAVWHDLLGQIEAERGRWIEAGEAFATAGRLAPDDAVIARHLARARIALGDPSGAATSLAALLRTRSTDAAAWSLLARAHEAAGETDAALDALTEALRLDDAWPEDRQMLARLTADRERTRAAERLAAPAPPPAPPPTPAPALPPLPLQPSAPILPPSAPSPTPADVARIAALFAAGAPPFGSPVADRPADAAPDGAATNGPASDDTADDATEEAMTGSARSAADDVAETPAVAAADDTDETDNTAETTDIAAAGVAPYHTAHLADDVPAEAPIDIPADSPADISADISPEALADATGDAPLDVLATTVAHVRPDAATPTLRPPMLVAPDDASAVTQTAALLSVAGMYQESGHAAAAYVVIRRAQDDLPPSATLARRAGELALTLGDAASAVQQLSLAVALDAEDVASHRALATAQTALGRHAEALEALQAAAARCPGDADLWLDVARAADAAGEPGSARAALGRAATAAPDRPDVHAAAAAAAQARGDIAAARDAYERAAAHDPTDPRFVLPLVDLCLDDAPERALALLARLPSQADVLARRAELFARRGDWPAAIEAWSAARALPTAAGDLSLAIRHADALVHAGRPADAALLLESATPSLTPRPPSVNAVLGRAYASIGRDRDALMAWSAAAAADALDAPALVAYSRLAGRLGALDEAVRAAENAVLRDGTLSAACAAHADALLAAGRLEAAGKAAQAALELAPDDPDAYDRLARLAHALGRPDDAIAALQAGIARIPEAAALQHALGRALAARHDDDGARAHFARAAAIAPHVPDYQRDLAASLADNDPSGALDALERVVAAAPEDPDAFRAKADLERSAGDTSAARGSLARAVTLAPDRPDLWLALAEVCLADGDAAAADAALDEAHRLSPYAPDLHMVRGAVHEAADRLPAALDSYETAARLAPHAATAWSAVGRLRLARADVAGALTALAEAVRHDDQDPATHRALAEALERTGQPADAATQWAIARRLAPDDPDALLGLGRARLSAGDAHGAVAVLRQALPSRAADAALHALLAQALLATHRLDEAREHAAQAAALDPRSPEAWRAVATTRRAADDLRGARSAMAEAARLAPSAEAFTALARLDEELDDPTAAALSWRHVLERDPEDAVAALRFAQHVAGAGWQLELAVPAPAPSIDPETAAYAERVLLRARDRLDGADAAAAERAMAVVRGRTGQVGGAIESAHAAVAIQPAAESLLVRAWAQLANGDPNGALADLRLAAARGADDARRHALAARAHAANGDTAAAAESLLAAIERAPDVVELQCQLAEQQLAAGDRSAAAATLRLAGAVATDAGTERRLAGLALSAGAPEVACTVLEARAAEDPNDTAPLLLLAEARRRLGDMPGAQEALERAVRYAPERPEAQAQLGDLLFELDDPEAARARYGKAIALQPYQPTWRLADAAALLRLGRRDEARATLTDALTFAPSSVEVRLRLAALQLEDGAAKAALDVLEPARTAAPDDARVHYHLGLAQRALGNAEAAVASLDAAARLSPSDPRPFVALGDLHRGRDEMDDCIQAYEQAVAVAPRVADVYLRLAGACRQAGMVERALLIHEQAVDLAPDDAAPRLAFGQMLAELGHFARAVEVLDPTIGLMVEADPRLAETLTLIANLYNRLDQHERARPYLEQAHALRPDDHSGKRLRANQIVQLFARSRAKHANGAPRDTAL